MKPRLLSTGSSADNEGALTVWCPRCHANPDTPCVRNGKALREPHVLRVYHWREKAA